jgi:hypothetical protein
MGTFIGYQKFSLFYLVNWPSEKNKEVVLVLAISKKLLYSEDKSLYHLVAYRKTASWYERVLMHA